MSSRSAAFPAHLVFSAAVAYNNTAIGGASGGMRPVCLVWPNGLKTRETRVFSRYQG